MASRFGEMLLDRRRELGLSIQQVANVIKIRPQIIEFFETGNFASMPPRGYAQGMIASYARYLGLNPREVVNAYFDELYVYERGGSASGSQFTEGATDPVPRSVSTSGRYLLVDPPSSSSRFAQRPPQAGYVSDSTSGHVPMRVADNQRRASQLPERDGARRALRPASGSRGGYGAPASGGGMPADSTVQMRRPLGSAGTRDLSGRGRAPQRTRGYGSASGRRGPGGYGSRGRGPQRGGSRGAASGLDQRLLIGGAAVIVILLIIIVFLLVRGCTPAANQTTPTVQGSAATQQTQTNADDTATDGADDQDAQDTDQPEDGAADGQQNANDPATGAAAQQQVPTETKIAITVDEGATSWIEVKVDGEVVYGSQTAGPETLEYVPGQTIEITVDHPSDVSVTENGKTVDWDTRTPGVGRVTITVPQPPEPDPATEEQSADGESTGEDTSTDEGYEEDTTYEDEETYE